MGRLQLLRVGGTSVPCCPPPLPQRARSNNPLWCLRWAGDKKADKNPPFRSQPPTSTTFTSRSSRPPNGLRGFQAYTPVWNGLSWSTTRGALAVRRVAARFSEARALVGEKKVPKDTMRTVVWIENRITGWANFTLKNNYTTVQPFCHEFSLLQTPAQPS